MASRLARASAAWDRFWFGPVPLARLAAFRIVILAAALEAAWRFRRGVFQHADAVDVDWLRREWRPIYAFELAGLDPPGPLVARAVWIGLMASIALGVVGLFTRTACAVAAALTTYWIAVHYSFGKPHHDCIALVFALAALPFAPVGARLSFDALRRRWARARRGEDPRAAEESAAGAALPMRIAQVTAAIGYFFSGATKLATVGPAWANGYSLQGILLEFHAPWTELLARDPAVCAVFSTLTLVLQTSFPLVLLFPRLAWIHVPAAVGFHIVSWKTMDTGPFTTLWLTLASFVALERVPAFLRGLVAVGHPIKRLAASAAFALLAAATLVVYVQAVPPWFLLALAPVALAVSLARVPGLDLRLCWPRACPRSARAVALVAALDWSRRVELVETDGEGLHELRSVDARGRSRTGFAALRAAAWRLPLALPAAAVASLPPIAAALDRRFASGSA